MISKIFLEFHTVSKEGQTPVYINPDRINSFTVDNLQKDAVTKALIYMEGGQIIHTIETVEEISSYFYITSRN